MKLNSNVAVKRWYIMNNVFVRTEKNPSSGKLSVSGPGLISSQQSNFQMPKKDKWSPLLLEVKFDKFLLSVVVIGMTFTLRT
jgi:hypothetical protein